MDILNEKQFREELKNEYFKDVEGLDNVLDKLLEFYNVLRLQKDREEANIRLRILDGAHFAIVGSRGSGKTMVGKIIGRMLHKFGIREDEKAVILNSREISEGYNSNREIGIEQLFMNQNEKTVIIENLQNVFIDNAYDKLTCRRIMICLDKILHKKQEEISIIITLDKDAMAFIKQIDADFVDVLYDTIEIERYSIESLIKIAEHIAYEERGLIIREEAEKTLFHKIDQNYHNSNFMNAISIKRYLDDAVKKMAERYYKTKPNEPMALAELQAEDFEMEFREESIEEILQDLNSLTGLNEVKNVIQDVINRANIAVKARQNNANSMAMSCDMQLIFTGNPGTGKTTVARMLGKIYQQLGILPRGHHTVECSRGNLVGLYQGHTADAVRKKFIEAEGGVLFIDEAYSLCMDDGDTFGREAVDELTKQIEDHHDDVMVIIAGYDKQIDKFLETNAGLKSRFQRRIRFEDYNVDEMVSIFMGMLKKQGKYMEEGSDEIVTQLLAEKSKMPDFGNARGVRNVVGSVISEQSERLQKEIMELEDKGDIMPEFFDCIRKSDIEGVLNKKMAGEKTVDELLQEMQAMPGLGQAKKMVQEQIDRIRFQKIMRDRGIAVEQSQGTMHMLFKGNAGTGKTTMARIIAQIYQKLGILKKNTLLEVKRADLVGRYSGETAQKTLSQIEKAEGGILFIDEAYDLVNSENDSFGREALDALVADLENRRENLIVIMAGYGSDLDRLMEYNQGLASRFPNHVYFEDYSLDDLTKIFYSMLNTWNGEGLFIQEGLESKVRELIEKRKSKTDNFGNARGVRNIIESVKRTQESRIVREVEAGNKLSDRDLFTINSEDIMTEIEE